MGENIDPTWLACASRAELDPARFAEGLERVRRHYSTLVDYPIATRLEAAGKAGIAVIEDAEPACRWPHFAADEIHAIATAYVPTGWERIAGSVPLAEAPLALARRLSERPEDASRKLNAPAALAVLDRGRGRLTVVNDALGAARVYEAEAGGVRAWSNRPGALVLFLALEARADTQAWLVLAAASWFLGDTAPIEGMRRLPGGTVIEAALDGIAERRTRAAEEWVTSPEDLGALAEATTLVHSPARRPSSGPASRRWTYRAGATRDSPLQR